MQTERKRRDALSIILRHPPSRSKLLRLLRPAQSDMLLSELHKVARTDEGYEPDSRIHMENLEAWRACIELCQKVNHEDGSRKNLGDLLPYTDQSEALLIQLKKSSGTKAARILRKEIPKLKAEEPVNVYRICNTLLNWENFKTSEWPKWIRSYHLKEEE